MNLLELIAQAKYTILLGKNGAGKSTLLRTLIDSQPYEVKYVSPERGGTLKYNPTVDQNMSHAHYLKDSRRQNRLEQFRDQSAIQFRLLETQVLRQIEKERRDDKDFTFDSIISQVNELLPNIKMVRNERGFSIASKTDAVIDEAQISSGEAELIALSIEVLVFSRLLTGKEKLLLLDEPDVHLHPDLQQQFVRFVENVAQEYNIRVAIATHSTAIIGAFGAGSDLQIAPVTSGNAELVYFKRDEIVAQVLPVFGAHPLSSLFNDSPVLLVEGDDEKRILDQVVRSTKGAIRYSPCVVGSVDVMAEWEDRLNKILPAIYDNPRAYSLRDLDDSSQTDIGDTGIVQRIRLNCYAIENLLLCKQCLAEHGFRDDQRFIEKLVAYTHTFSDHKYAGDVTELAKNFGARRTLKIKNVRNIIVGLLGTNKPWEVLVGQLIARHYEESDSSPDSLKNYLGEKAVGVLFTKR
jgi:ABC-type branched-subunit amino acid transport system ATPase component